ncbi:MAG: beta-galactosidase, partial [Clostridiales bacterium]|nr:beta-galactosidase [Candidatus Blautia equi]
KWLADKYPEVLRVNAKREKDLFGGRHNHCYTSPVYREKTRIINTKLAQKFGNHPGVIMWHISNEYGGDCHCPLCQEAFREWLKERYENIEEVNKRWATTFWSHTYNSFDQIESPSPRGEMSVHGLNLDWKRFVTERTRDFLHHEVQCVREGGSNLPVTANLMYDFVPLNNFELAKEIDIVSWDTYPTWHKQSNADIAYDNGMFHDLMRSLKGKPFFQMESCPSSTNWQGVSKLKRPGVLFSQSMQAIAHGGEGAMYFQIRQSRGSTEKFHGAVIDHYGGMDTRVFKEVTKVGDTLKELAQLTGSTMKSRAAIVFDWESRWAMEDSQGPRNNGLFYHEAVKKYYRAFRKLGIGVDFIDMTCELDGYDIVVAPMLYMFRAGFEKKVRAFVERGGQFVMTYWSGIADYTDRTFLGGTPHDLMDVMGLRSTEIDGLYDWETNKGVPGAGNALGLEKEYTCRYLCDLVELRGAEALMTYGEDFYAGYPAITVNKYGAGKAWYVAADFDADFQVDFLRALCEREGISGVVPGSIPDELEVTLRERVDAKYYIYQNWGSSSVSLPLPEGEAQEIYGKKDALLEPLDLAVLKC